MASKTNRWLLQKLDPGDDLSEDSYAFVSRDRDLLDALLEYSVEEHRHTGLTASETVLDAPSLSLDTTTGGIPGGERVRYKYSLVDADGFETAASAESYIDTPESVLEPSAPVLTNDDAGGTHIPGQYFYVLSAYQDFTTSETLATSPGSIYVPPVTSTNAITIQLPELPDGATGFNIYRRAPGAIKYFFLASVDMDVATPPEEYVDDNTVDEDCDRSLPVENSTYSTNTITVSFPGATPVVPDGYTWKIYRTYTSDEYSNSFLHWVVEETFEDSGIIAPTYDDEGEGTGIGSPPTSGNSHGTPPKISLTDAAEVDGVLPPGLNVVPFEVTFGQPGALVETEGEFVWRFPFDYGLIISCTATLGKNSYPSSTDVIVDVNIYRPAEATPGWTSIYSDNASIQPRVLVGEFYGDPAFPDIVDVVEGDMFTIDIDQTGGGATPTDADLTLTMYMLVQSESRTLTTDMG